MRLTDPAALAPGSSPNFRVVLAGKPADLVVAPASIVSVSPLSASSAGRLVTVRVAGLNLPFLGVATGDAVRYVDSGGQERSGARRDSPSGHSAAQLCAGKLYLQL